MLKFTIKRILAAIPTLLITFTIVFLVVRIIPGDASAQVLGEEATLEQVEAWREAHGLNKSLLEQYLDFVTGALTGDMGVSLLNSQPVVKTIARYLEPTIMLVIMSTLISIIIGIPIGIIAALKRNSLTDKIIMTVSMLGLATPSFWLGLMLCLWFAVQLRWFPVAGYKSIAVGGFWNAVKCLILPAVSLGFQRVSNIARFTRSCMLDVIRSDYVRTARAKGVSERVIVLKHMLRTTMGPVVTTIGQGIAAEFAGALVTERIFNVPGIGLLTYNSIFTRDLPVVQAVVVYVAMVYVVINIILDILYKYFDPRIELK